MKECSREKVLKGKKSHNDPPYPFRRSVGPGGQRDQEHQVVLHDQGEEYQQPITSISLSYPNPVMNQTKSRSKYPSLGLTLLNARSNFHVKFHKDDMKCHISLCCAAVYSSVVVRCTAVGASCQPLYFKRSVVNTENSDNIL